MSVFLKCVAEGSRLRVKIISPGYLNDANCQFPRHLRSPGRFFSVSPADVTLSQQGSSGKFFYRVHPSANIHSQENEPTLSEIMAGLRAAEETSSENGPSSSSSARTTNKRRAFSSASSKASRIEEGENNVPIKNIKVYEDPEDPDCIVCLDSSKAVILVPCGHYCLCNCCADHLFASTAKCPLCRSAIRTTCKPEQIG